MEGSLAIEMLSTHEVRAELGPRTSLAPCPPRLRDILTPLGYVSWYVGKEQLIEREPD